MENSTQCPSADVWQVVLQSQAVCSSICTTSSIQRLSKELNHAVKVHCQGRLDVDLSASSLDTVRKFCYWLQAGNWEMMCSLELRLSPLHEEVEIDRAVELLGRVLEQGAGLKRLNLQSYRCHDAAGSSSLILRPISCSKCLQSMQLVVGVPHWAGACASRDEYAGTADSGLQVITASADQGLQQTAAALGACKGLRSLSVTVVQTVCMVELGRHLSGLDQLSELQLSVVAGLQQLQQLPYKQLQSIRISSIISSREMAAAADLSEPPSPTSPETSSQPSAMLSRFSALRQLVCPQGLVIKVGDQLPANLQELRVAGVAAVQPLLPLTQLQELDADVSELTAEHLMQLSSSVPKLRSLQLCYNKVVCSTHDRDVSADSSTSLGHHSMTALSSADRAAAAWTSLPIRGLSISCSMSTATLMQISHMGSCLQRLSILAAENDISIAHLAAALQQLTLLQSLTLQFSCQPNSEMGAAAELVDTAASEGSAYADAAGLQSMGHGSSDWGLELVQSLASLPLLYSLSLVAVPLGGAAAGLTLAGLRSAASLRHLKLLDCGMTDATLVHILARLTSLRALFVGSSCRASSAASTVGDGLLPAVAALTQLRTLCLTGTALSPAGEARLTGLAHLDSLYVGP